MTLFIATQGGLEYYFRLAVDGSIQCRWSDHEWRELVNVDASVGKSACIEWAGHGGSTIKHLTPPVTQLVVTTGDGETDVDTVQWS